MHAKMDGQLGKYALWYAYMDGIVTQHDWTLIKSFATVGECGSLSAASRAIGTAQSTLSRHISTLEQEVGTRLFERAASGVVLTPTGVELMRSAQAMADAAGQFSKTIKGNTDVYSGSVRITASKLIATYVLPDLLHKNASPNPARYYHAQTRPIIYICLCISIIPKPKRNS